jgi:hypothetical protein
LGIGRISCLEVTKVALDDLARYTTHGVGDRCVKMFPLFAWALIDFRDNVSRGKCGVFDFREKVLSGSDPFRHTDFHQGVVSVRSVLGEVKRVMRCAFCVTFRHNLNHDTPIGKVFLLYLVKQVPLAAFAIGANDAFRLVVRQILIAPHRPEVEFDPVPLVARTDKAVGVGAKSVHMTKALWQTPIREHHCYLVQTLGGSRPETPHRCRTPLIGLRIALRGVNKIGELIRIAGETNRSVIGNEVPVSFFGT